jgi:hypothetical protein
MIGAQLSRRGKGQEMQSFLLVLVDHDKKVFSIEGPMDDDKLWADALVAAQERGRSVTFFRPSQRASREMVVESVKTEIGYRQTRLVLSPDL